MSNLSLGYQHTITALPWWWCYRNISTSFFMGMSVGILEEEASHLVMLLNVAKSPPQENKVLKNKLDKSLKVCMLQTL